MSEWLQHDGKGMPVPVGTLVSVMHRRGDVDGPYRAGYGQYVYRVNLFALISRIIAGKNCWTWGPLKCDADIIAYRIIDDGAEAKRRAARKAMFDNMAKEALNDGIRKAPRKERA